MNLVEWLPPDQSVNKLNAIFRAIVHTSNMHAAGRLCREDVDEGFDGGHQIERYGGAIARAPSAERLAYSVTRLRMGDANH